MGILQKKDWKISNLYFLILLIPLYEYYERKVKKKKNIDPEININSPHFFPPSVPP